MPAKTRVWNEKLQDLEPDGEWESRNRLTKDHDAAEYLRALADTIDGTFDKSNLWWAAVMKIEIRIARQHDVTELTFDRDYQ